MSVSYYDDTDQNRWLVVSGPLEEVAGSIDGYGDYVPGGSIVITTMKLDIPRFREEMRRTGNMSGAINTDDKAAHWLAGLMQQDLMAKGFPFAPAEFYLPLAEQGIGPVWAEYLDGSWQIVILGEASPLMAILGGFLRALPFFFAGLGYMAVALWMIAQFIVVVTVVALVWAGAKWVAEGARGAWGAIQNAVKSAQKVAADLGKGAGGMGDALVLAVLGYIGYKLILE